MEYSSYTEILRQELIPAMGCTEPISLAYAAAECRMLLGSVPEKTIAECSGHIIKNVMGVTIPNTGGMKGIEAAIASGIVIGDSSKGLEILSAMDARLLACVRRYREEYPIEVRLLDTDSPLHFIITMFAGVEQARVELADTHMNIVRKERNGRVVYSANRSKDAAECVLSDITQMSIDEIIGYSETVPLETIIPILKSQLELNSRICSSGLESSWGAGIGKLILKSEEKSLLSRMKAYAASGSDARMSGCVSPVVINSGSGNQGITVSMPVKVFAEDRGYPEELLIRALAISNLVAIYEKRKIGRLSAFCGAVNAASGVSAAITWLDTRDNEKIKAAISNTLAIASGIICDGAKPSCAAKISIAVESAYLGFLMASCGDSFHSDEGIVKDDIEKTIDGVAEIARDGMKETDAEILKVMLDKSSR